ATAAPPVSASPASPPVQPPVRADPVSPAPRPVYDVPEALGPEHDRPDAPPRNDRAPADGMAQKPAPSVAPVSQAPRDPAPLRGAAALDFAPEARGPAAGGAPIPGLDGERRPHIAAPAADAARPAKPVKAPRPRKGKRRRPVLAAIFSAAVMLSFG